jgi:hypothetical protein
MTMVDHAQRNALLEHLGVNVDEYETAEVTFTLSLDVAIEVRTHLAYVIQADLVREEMKETVQVTLAQIDSIIKPVFDGLSRT